jgi:class I fructose-bisphosphate aldolase
MNNIIKDILQNYQSENPGVKANLYKLLNHGTLAGTGNLVILPVDQGFEHGPEKSFAANPLGYDPHYHFQLAIDAKLSAFAAPLGMLQAGASEFAGQIPLILKVNHSNSLNKSSIDQAVISSVETALQLGCIGIGFTVYPGSDHFMEMIEELSYLAEEARKYGLLVVVWSYARGPELGKDDETAMDVISYAAHMVCLSGAHIVKVKLPTAHLKDKSLDKAYMNINDLSERVKYVVRSCFNGKRLVVFSGGATKNDDELYNEIKAIKSGGGTGSIIGRNGFQRKKKDALKMFEKITEIYRVKFD